jgi:hypothetical protein
MENPSPNLNNTEKDNVKGQRDAKIKKSCLVLLRLKNFFVTCFDLKTTNQNCKDI